MDLDTLRELCLSLPGATEEVQWENHLLFKVGGKMFCITDLDGSGGTAFKVTEEEFDELTAQPGIIGAPHLARAKWVKVMEHFTLKPKEWKHYIHQSYELIRSKLPKRIQAELGEIG